MNETQFKEEVQRRGRVAENMFEAYMKLTKSHEQVYAGTGYESRGRAFDDGEIMAVMGFTVGRKKFYMGIEPEMGFGRLVLSQEADGELRFQILGDGYKDPKGNPEQISRKLKSLTEIARFYQEIINKTK